MSWTPHSREDLMAHGVQFGIPDTVSNPTPVIIHSGGQVPAGTNTIPQNGYSYIVNNGISAKELESVTGSLGSQLSQFGDALSSGFGALGSSVSSGFDNLYNLIMKNTDKNNAWSAQQAQKQMNFQERMQNLSMDFNASEAAKNRNWQEMMSNTAHQREIADLQAAGLNPVLSATGGNGASVGSGASASVGTPSGAKGDPDQSANSALVSLYGALINAQTQMYNANLSAKTNLQMSENQKEAAMYGSMIAANASIENSQRAAEASMYNSGVAAAASQYSADNQFKMLQEQLSFNESHPNNPWQLGSGLASAAGINKGTVSNWFNQAKNLLGFGSGSSSSPAKKSSTSRVSARR